MKGKVFGRGLGKASRMMEMVKAKYQQKETKSMSDEEELDYEGEGFFHDLENLMSDKPQLSLARDGEKTRDEIEVEDPPSYVENSTKVLGKRSETSDNKNTKMMGRQKPTKQLSLEETMTPPDTQESDTGEEGAHEKSEPKIVERKRKGTGILSKEDYLKMKELLKVNMM